MIPTCIYILSYESYQYRIEQLPCLGLSVAWVTCRYSQVGGYYYTHDEMVEKKWRPGRELVWVLMGATSYVPRPTGLAWLYCFSCLCQLGLFDTMDGSHVTDLIIPSTYLLMGAGRPVLFVSWFPALSVLTAWRRRQVGGSCTALKPSFSCGGLESQFGAGTWKPQQERKGLAFAYANFYNTSKACVFWGTQLGILVCESPSLRYDLANVWHRSKKWKIMKLR